MITSSDNCMKKHNELMKNTDRFNNVNIPKITSSLSFFCDPYKHNPIRIKNQRKENIATFIGGFYTQFKERCEIQYKMFDEILNNNIPFEIIDRFYFIDKLIEQVSLIDYNNLLIDQKYKKFNNPPVKHNLSHKVYKKSKLHININTVTDCKTMLSRRLIELLGCGAHVYSNNSKSIDNFNLNIINNINYKIFNNLPEINLDGFYNVHLNLSSVTFIENIYNILNLNLKKKIKVRIIPNNNRICNEYIHATKLLENECDFTCYLKNNNYIYNKLFFDKLFIHLNYFQGNIAFTNDETNYFTIDSLCNIQNKNDIIIQKKNCNKVLYIPELKIEKPLINILTRTSKRPNFFKECITSINNQLSNKKKIIKYNLNIFNKKKRKNKELAHNLYLNSLKSSIKIIVDKIIK